MHEEELYDPAVGPRDPHKRRIGRNYRPAHHPIYFDDRRPEPPAPPTRPTNRRAP